MDTILKNMIKLNYDEIEKYKFPFNEVFALQINHEEVFYHFIIRLSSKSNKLLCFSPGAQSRTMKTTSGKSITPPYFHRWSWYKYFDESFISCADPTFLYDDTITLGWFVGNKNEWYLKILSEIIKKILNNLNIKNENTIFFGSSGGGFVSIALGTLIKDSKVIANNSQFFILNFEQYHINNLFRLLRKSFCQKDEEIIPQIKHRLNIIELFKRENYVPEINYYVNLYSKADINNQFLPFIQEISNLDIFEQNLNIHLYKGNKKIPHDPMGTQQTIKIIKSKINTM